MSELLKMRKFYHQRLEKKTIRDGGQGRGRADAGSRRGGKGMSIPALDAGG
jgi:hypothetical protein